MRVSLRWRLVALILAFAVVAVGCGGDDDAEGSGATVGVQSGTTGESYATDNVPDGVDVQSFDGADALFAALEAGEVDAILQDLPVNAERAANDDGLEVVEEYETDEDYGFAVEKGNVELLSLLNNGLSQLATSGELQTIYDVYFPAGEPPLYDGLTAAEAPDLGTPGQLTVCSDMPYEPFEFVADDGTVTGYDIDIMRAIAEGAGLAFEVLDVEFDGILGNLAAGSCDVVASALTINDERAAEVDFTEPYYSSKQSLLVPADSDIASLADLG